jgi:opacity protein-like surface antigen
MWAALTVTGYTLKSGGIGSVKNLHVLGVTACISLLAGPAHAADPDKLYSDSTPYNWTGYYAGLAAGVALGQYDSRTSTISDGYIGPAGTAVVNATGIQTINSTGFVAGIEGGYNWQIGNVLLGLEADAQSADLDGAGGSGAVHYTKMPGQFTITSYGETNWLSTVRPRIGYVAPNHWLFYATGGLALAQLQSDFSFVDNKGVFESGRLDAVRAGYAVGGGIEAPLTDRLSLKAEYLYVDFGNTPASVTANDLTPFFPGQVFAHSSDFKADIIRAGLNYRFGGDDQPSGWRPVMPFTPPQVLSPFFAGWEMEAGARLWVSSGTVGAPQPLLNAPPLVLASRLTYSDLDALSGETFARADHASGFFVKGILGAGGIIGGSLNDEDFPAGPTYSNTLSGAAGHIGYATIDVGYNVWRGPDAKVGPFVGYNYYTQAINTYGCTQVAGSTVCSPALPSALLVLTENDSLNSLRVGLSGEVMLTDRLKVTADAAYVPLVSFSGLDDHLLRQLLLPEASNSGNGVMIEATLDYYLTWAWSIGVGARYWAWNINTGTETFNFLTAPSPITEPARFTAERYGAFVQSSYRFGDPPSSARDPQGLLVKAPAPAPASIDWTGFYAGGHFGGGFSNAQWSDPFASTMDRHGFINAAGFGDSTHATGPLGGGQIGVNWQIGHLVLGAGVDASAANFRGENTCFSGLGGIDCQHAVNSLVSLTGRAGYAWDRSLVYAKGGGAWTDTSYALLGDTNALTLGTGVTTLAAWGWTVGAGIEYALTRHWTAFGEYDHVGVPPVTVPFPTVAIIGAQTIRQSIDVFKLGVNYKFELADLAAVGSVIAKN